MLSPVQRQEAYSQKAQEYILKNPGGFLLRVVFRVTNFWGFDVLAGGSLKEADVVLGVIFLAGDALLFGIILWIFLAGNKRLGGTIRQSIWILVGLYMLPYLLAFAHPSYHLPLLPWMLFFGFYALNRQLPLKCDRNGYLSLIITGIIQLVWIGDLLARI